MREEESAYVCERNQPPRRAWSCLSPSFSILSGLWARIPDMLLPGLGFEPQSAMRDLDSSAQHLTAARRGWTHDPVFDFGNTVMQFFK